MVSTIIQESPNFFKRLSNCYQIEKGKYQAKGLWSFYLGLGGWVGLIILILHFTLLP